MTDEELPTALEVTKVISIGADVEPTEHFKKTAEKGNKLYLGKDVEKLIEEEILDPIRSEGRPETREDCMCLVEEVLEEVSNGE